MAITTAEIYEIDQESGKRAYAGYAKFDGDNYLGSFGGYGGDKNQNAKNKGSKVQNKIKTTAARQGRRKPSVLR